MHYGTYVLNQVFIHRLLFSGKLVCVCMCVFPPGALITIYVTGTHNNWLNQLYSFYMTLAIDKVGGSGFSTRTHCECLAQKTKLMPQKEMFKLPSSRNKTEHFSYLGKWVNM